jgi:CRP-like cAMP-binding protein
MEQTQDLFSRRGFTPLPLSMQQKAEKLEATTWAKGLTWHELVTLAMYMNLYEFPPETSLCRQGETQSYMCLILSGKADILKENSDGTHKKITSIGSNNTIGEMSLIDGEPRSASSITTETSLIFVLTSETYQRFAELHTKLWGKLAQKIAKLLSQRLRQTSGALVDLL